ncbi:MAG: alpha/beta hydrolase, partial [Rariglobus sp.]
KWFTALQQVLPPAAEMSKNGAESSPTPAHASAPVTALHVAPSSLRLWEGDAPGLPSGVGPEVNETAGRVSNVSVPMLDVYLPAREKANGTAIIIVSGGGYGRLASGPLGAGAARLFVPQGFAVFSLKYRTSSASKDVLTDVVADGAQAMRLVRSRAAEWGIDPKRVGMVGFSAGANLILNLATTANAEARPDFVGLAATWPYKQKITSFTIDGRVPPAFVLHTKDDTSARFTFAEEIVAAWRAAGVPVEFQPRDTGGHMAFNSFKSGDGDWPAQFQAWLRRQGFVRD